MSTTLTHATDRELIEELLRRGNATTIMGASLEGDYVNRWLIKHESASEGHPDGCYMVGSGRTFGLIEVDNLGEAMEHLAEVAAFARHEKEAVK